MENKEIFLLKRSCFTVLVDALKDISFKVLIKLLERSGKFETYYREEMTRSKNHSQ